MFENFKKRKLVNATEKSMDVLAQEFEQEKHKFAALANNDMYKFMVEYFEAKIEINRDRLELLNPVRPKDAAKMVELLAENRCMRSFMDDIQSMQAMYEN